MQNIEIKMIYTPLIFIWPIVVMGQKPHVSWFLDVSNSIQNTCFVLKSCH